MKRMSLRWITAALMLAAMLIIPGFASAKEIEIPQDQLKELEGIPFTPEDINDKYIAGYVTPSNKVLAVDSTGKPEVIELPVFTFVRGIKLVDNNLVYMTYKSASASESDFTVWKHQIGSASPTKLLTSNESITLHGASEKGFIYTVNSMFDGDDLWYYDFSTGSKTLIEKNIESVDMSGNLIVYTLPRTLMENNEEIYYVNTDSLNNKMKVPYQGTDVKTNGQYIAFWYNINNLSGNRMVVVYDLSIDHAYSYSQYPEGKSVNQNLVFAGDDNIVWNSDNWSNNKYTTHIYNLKNDYHYVFDQSLRPIAASSSEVLLSSPSSSAIYFLPIAKTVEERKRFPMKTNVPLDYPFTVEFSADIDKSTVNKKNVLVFDAATGEQVDVEIMMGSDPRKIQIKPLSNYKAGNKYRILIKKGITDLNGSDLKQEVEKYFITQY